MEVLNLYAGVGGNRKMWKDVKVTAVELDPSIAKVYQDKIIPGETMVEIRCNGKVHYRRPDDHPDVKEARKLIEQQQHCYGKSSYEIREIGHNNRLAGEASPQAAVEFINH